MMSSEEVFGVIHLWTKFSHGKFSRNVSAIVLSLRIGWWNKIMTQ